MILFRWLIAFTGLGLLFAPLVFWAPEAGIFIACLLSGSLLITFSVLVPGLPGEDIRAGPAQPSGWNYNPSSWSQRVPIIIVALLGFGASSYLAFYQLGYIRTVWDPFFGEGTRKVLESEVSKAFPVSDAGLGALTYLVEALSGLLGSTRRWRTAPWAVVLFGILVIPAGLVSLILVMLQPVAVGSWCTLCLITAFLTLIMISPALDEVIATGQFLVQSRRENTPFWRAFFKGGTRPSEGQEPRRAEESGGPWTGKLLSGLDILSTPWNVLLCALIGVRLMAGPGHNEILTGALVVTVSVIAFGEVARPVRLLNIPLAAWLIASGNFWPGLALGLLSVRRGRIRERHGPWDKLLI